MRRRKTSQRRTSRRNRNVYLGKRVRDTGKPGLDNLREVRGIANAIIYDYTHHKIPYRTAMSRMNLLELVVSRDSDFQGRKEAMARNIIDRARARLTRMRR
ncbi:MAG: hypothetical protein H0Z18_09210 [Thermococcus sp.]|uniref:hypothetical protein n=1 Tax=Thermococcus sp. TaxID=35749 RepID=UPI001D2F23F5|nr:hypothetical protein [Thermococcus sp.]MBO8175422.1 hypothetical protein [Thermococcus sp.]